MEILPNSLERYIASLRHFVALSITKYGINKRRYENLKKLYFCETIYNKNSTESVDINKLTINLLNAASNIEATAKFKVKVKGDFIINKNLYSYLLLKIFKNRDLKVFIDGNFLCIKYSGETENLSAIISALNGFYLQEIKTAQNLIIIPIRKTTKPSVYIESEWEYLFDSFSIVNLIFKTIP